MSSNNLKNGHLSIIVPFRNAGVTLEKCLNSVIDCHEPDIDLIAVNDFSQDKSRDICKKFPCRVIDLDRNYGAAFARNEGAENAVSESIIFMDADTEIIDKDTISYLRNFLKEHQDFCAIQGVYSPECISGDILSTYKHLYICFLQEKRKAEQGDFCTALILIKKDVFLETGKFTTHLRTSANEDTEFGLRLQSRGYRFYTDNKIKIRHNQHYGLKTFVKMEYYRSLNQTIIFLSNMLKKKRDLIQVQFSHKPAGSYISLMLVVLLYLFLLLFPEKIILITVAITVLFLVNMEFINYLRRKKGLGMFLLSLPILVFDFSICILGILSGVSLFIFKKERI